MIWRTQPPRLNHPPTKTKQAHRAPPGRFRAPPEHFQVISCTPRGLQLCFSPPPPQPHPWGLSSWAPASFFQASEPFPFPRQQWLWPGLWARFPAAVFEDGATPHHTTPHHTTPHHTTPHHTTPHHTTPQHTLSTPQLYPRAGCRVRSPRRQGPGTAELTVLTVSDARTSQCQASSPGTPRPLVPAASALGTVSDPR